jgi:hypothetical protein
MPGHPSEVYAVWVDEALTEAEAECLPRLARWGGELLARVHDLRLEAIAAAAHELEHAVFRVDLGILEAREGWLPRLRRRPPVQAQLGARCDDVDVALSDLGRALSAFTAAVPHPQLKPVSEHLEMDGLRLRDLVEDAADWSKQLMRGLVKRSTAEENVRVMGRFAARFPGRLRGAGEAAMATERLLACAQRAVETARQLAGVDRETVLRAGHAWQARMSRLLEDLEEHGAQAAAARAAECEQARKDLVRAAQRVGAACEHVATDVQAMQQAQQLLARQAGQQP